MALDVSVAADLELTLELPGARPVTGSLTGSGTALELRVSDPFLFAGRSDAGAIRGVADGLAGRGLTLTVVAPTGPLVTLGAPRTSWLQRRVTGSRHIRVERGAGLWSLLRGRVQAPAGGALPARDLAPPATVFPLAPTFLRRPRTVTTTHDPSGGGNPRLIMAPRDDPWPGDRQEVFRLRSDATTIGSDPGCDIVLEGLAPVHARVLHDEDDELVLVRAEGRPEATRVNGAPADRALLRTAARVDLDRWTLTYFREEFADHGRPYGGRVGGELGHQKPQPERPQRRRRGTEDEERT
jgi:hypothetical protein